ncbi:MAG: hypothetical protein MJ249_14545 [Kiritimatiellae bacterium]|nr:hypothetical protein [Kiritimatiellia bacterium]
MKTLKENLKTMTVYAGADTVNAEGFSAWTPSDTTLLEQLAMTGTLGNSFYANAKDAAKDAVALLERADAGELAAAIVKGRNEGFIRTFPILGLVYLSKKDSALFQETFCKVVLTGNDLVDFIEMAKAVRGFGRSIKKAISDWIRKNATPYYAQKYRKQIADAIRLSRFKGEDSIYAYILNAYSGVKGATVEKLEKAYAEYPDLAAHRDFVAAVEAGDLRGGEEILRAKNIDVNSLTAWYDKFDKGLWSAVAARSPVMRFVKYLAKFIREDVLTEELLRSKENVEVLKQAKVFPFRLYTAYRAVSRDLERKDRKVLAYLAEVMDEYARTYDWADFAEARWVVAPDISGSMLSSIGGSSVLTYAAVSAMFAGFFMKGLKDVAVLPWDTEVQEYSVPAAEPIMKHIEAITSMVAGGTHMEASVKYMLLNRIEADYAVFLTDTMEYGKGWLASWKEYHRKYPKAVAFVLRGDSYMTAPIPEDQAAELNVYQIFGWNDSVMDYMKFVLAKRKVACS